MKKSKNWKLKKQIKNLKKMRILILEMYFLSKYTK